MSPPTTMRAYATGSRSLLVLLWRGITRWDVSHGVSVRDDVPTPALEAGEILVRVKTVALNPTDWKHIDLLSPPNSIIGCDFVGEVAVIGPEVPAGQWKVGERIGGVAHGGLYKDQGAFAQYVRVPHDVACKPSTTMSNHDAVTYGVSAVTAMQALYHNLSVPWPDTGKPASGVAPKSILIWGGSTASGLYAISMAAHAGVRVATTCSPHSFELVKKYGADAAFDYRSPTVAEDIIKQFPDVTAALDSICEGPSSAVCAKVIAANGGTGRVIRLLPSSPRGGKVKGVEFKSILAYTLTGKPFQWLAPLGPKHAAVPEDRAAAVRFAKLMPGVAEEWLKPIPVELVEGGWSGLEKGLAMMKAGKVSGRKLVVDLE